MLIIFNTIFRDRIDKEQESFHFYVQSALTLRMTSISIYTKSLINFLERTYDLSENRIETY